MATQADELTDRAATQFAVLRSLCYPDRTPVTADRTVETFRQPTTTHAETDGFQLNKINAGRFQKYDAESTFVTLLHEVTHTGDGIPHGRGSSAHSPTFWEEFQDNFNMLAESPRARRVVESLFGTVRATFDWKRARYRAVQNVSQVDGRSETIDERKAALADAIGYDAYDDFENSSWGLRSLVLNPRVDSEFEALQANLFSPTKRYADDYTDEELLTFVENHDGGVPLPLVVLNIDDWRADGPQIIDNDANWRIYDTGSLESKKALAVRERLGSGYAGLSAELLAMADDLPEYVEEACPIAIDEVRPNRIGIQKRSDF